MSYTIADGFSVFTNGYDNQIYSVGRGSSATTITSEHAVSTLEDVVVMRGTVTGTSARTKQTHHDSNGNQYPIDHATANDTGTYSLTYTLTVPGDYTVIATFSGTNSYAEKNHFYFLFFCKTLNCKKRQIKG
jgi:hypothetical protein